MAPAAKTKPTPARRSTSSARGLRGKSSRTPVHVEPSQPSADTYRQKVPEHRRRQASVAAILDSTLGQLAQCNPDLWERRAYLMLVGIVYERLALHEDEIATDELIALAKALAENRRVEINHRKHQMSVDHVESTPPGDGPLPRRFADVVRQVYGVEIERETARDGQAVGSKASDAPATAQSKNGGVGG